MKLPFSIPSSVISLRMPSILDTALLFSRSARMIFFGGFILFVVLGVGVFYFLGYRVTQDTYQPGTKLGEINGPVLEKALERLESQKTKATGEPQDVFR